MRDRLTPQDYQRALEAWPTELMRLVRNVAVMPNWIEGQDRFWFRDEQPKGHRFRLVDATTGAVTDAFDHGAAARALHADPDHLPIMAFRFDTGADVILAITGQGRFRVDLTAATAQPIPPDDPDIVPGPGGQALFIRDWNLWLRAKDGSERPLTKDGVHLFAWGMTPDHDLRSVARTRMILPPTPFGCFWSGDGRRVLVQRCDQRALEPYPYLESVPADGSTRPKVHWVRQQLAGDAEGPLWHWYVLDVTTGARIQVDPLPDRLVLTAAANGGAWWSDDSAKIYALAASSNCDHAALVEIAAESGKVRILHDERATTFFDFNTFEYNSPNVRYVPSRQQMIWYSQADGWGHLYLIDLVKGGVVRQVTQGTFAVFDIIHVSDESIFFSAGGHEPGRNPYDRYLYRVDLDGAAPNAGLKLLTPEDADHGFSGQPTPLIARALGRPSGLSQMAPSGRYFLDCVSSVNTPTVYILRDAMGRTIAEIARADASALMATGWQPPERFSAKAADGTTDLYGVLVKPRGFDPDRSWPVLERIYGGPQIIAQPRSFAEGLNGPFMYALQTIADFGFVVAVLDGPGTPFRSKIFHDLTYDQADRWGIAHHRAALEGAAQSRPWMDLSCVGISGHSYGGYATAMAMLLEPDFYKVGVSSAGMYDPDWAHQAVPERHLGRPRYEDGGFIKPNPAARAINYQKFSPSTYAQALAGRLLLIYGDLDENIQPAALLKFADALIREGKSFDMLCMPGRNHGFSAEPYYYKRLVDYFIEHVQGREPLRHQAWAIQAGVRAFI